MRITRAKAEEGDGISDADAPFECARERDEPETADVAETELLREWAVAGAVAAPELEREWPAAAEAAVRALPPTEGVEED